MGRRAAPIGNGGRETGTRGKLTMAFVERVFSGVQPTGNLHLGNYLGAIVNFVKLQETHNCLYCVVDMHALTQPVEVWGGPAELARNTREVTAAFIASGIDPKKHIVFNQSQVHEHAELAWVFNCVARVGWLNRMTQFKEKAGKDREAASVGLYDYPVLMAADIWSIAPPTCRSATTRSSTWSCRAISPRNSTMISATRSAATGTTMDCSFRSRSP